MFRVETRPARLIVLKIQQKEEVMVEKLGVKNNRTEHRTMTRKDSNMSEIKAMIADFPTPDGAPP